MPLRNRIPTKLSARAVYAKQLASKETSGKGHVQTRRNSTSPMRVKSTSTSQNIVKKGRGRPKKPQTNPVKAKSNLQKKKSPRTRKRKSLVSFKSTTEIIGNHSSEADLSSEGEESDKSNDEDSVGDVELISNDDEVSNNENDQTAKEVVELSDDEGDVEADTDEEDDEGDVEPDFDEEDDEELASTDEIKGEQSDSEDFCYSFPEPSYDSSNLDSANCEQEDKSNSAGFNKKKKNKTRMSAAQLKKDLLKDQNDKKVLNSQKRKITQENAEESEENMYKPKKKKTSLGRANLPMESDVRSLNTPGSSRGPSFSPQHQLNRASTSFHSSTMSPHLHIDSIDSLIRLNKSVPCGNIAADQAFRWLIGPTLPVDFFHNMFEKMPFMVPRENRHYYKDLFSGNDLNAMFKEHNLEYKVHIDVVKYVKGMRIPITSDGRAYCSNVWEDYKQGYSLRVRNPQAYNKNLWKLCSLLQEYFSSTVGCNIYLTPPKAQGFPPHYDDIDAFIIQVEGKKYWKVYSPRYPEEELARYSSKDFAQNEIGNPLLQVCLNAGEMLYIPRGYIHQAATDSNNHSLHLTFSTNQLNTWGDLLLIAASKAVEKAMLNDVTFRESIPKDYMDHVGSSVADSKAFKRYELINKVKDLAKKAMSYIDVDEAADQHSIKFIQASLPPALNKIEKMRSLHGNGSYWRNGDIKLKGVIELDTEIQLINKRNLRLVIGDNNPRLYHTYENARDPRPVAEDEPLATYVEFEMEAVPSYLFLLKKYPDFVKVKDIPLEDEEDRIVFSSSLYENGLIMTKEILPHVDHDDFDWSSIPDIIPPFNTERSQL